MAPPWFDRWIRVHGADLRADELIVPGTANFTEVKFNHPPEWQSDPFLDPADRTRITIPKKLAGRYYVRVTIRWERSDNNDFQIADRDGSCFLTYVTKNGDADAFCLQCRPPLSLCPQKRSCMCCGKEISKEMTS